MNYPTSTIPNQMIEVKKIDTFSGHRDCVYALEAGAKPNEVFSAGGDGMVVAWDLARPDLGQPLAQMGASVYTMAFDATSNCLLVGQNYDGLHVINLSDRKEIAAIKVTSAAIFTVKIRAHNAFVGTSDGVIVVVDLKNFAIRKHIKASDQSVRSIDFNDSTGEMAVGYSDNHVRIFDAHSFDLKRVLEPHANSVFVVKYAPEAHYLLSAGRDARFKIWDIENNYAQIADVPAHLFAINDVVFSPDGQHFLTASMDKTIKVWDAQSFKLLKVIDRARHAAHGTSINRLLWTNYQNQVLSASDDRSISVWSLVF